MAFGGSVAAFVGDPMYTSPRAKPWETGGKRKLPIQTWPSVVGPVRVNPHSSHPNKSINRLSSVLCIAEDDFVDHSVTETSIIIECDAQPALFAAVIHRFSQRNKIAVINWGLSRRGYVVTFRSLDDLAMFRMFWTDRDQTHLE
jgi:hypothetical protein